ncbi:MAG: halocarboxylic acid dehydrogenase DehI family protein [Candidatus Bipolaricaulia bacterium]
MNVHDITEPEANETVQAIYEEIKTTLCVTYVPSFFRVLASHEAFFRQMWTSLEPTLTIYFVRAADALRASAVERGHPLSEELTLPDEEHDQLTNALWVIHFVAPKTLLAAASLEEALTSGATGASSRVVWPQNTGVPRGMPTPDFLHPGDADASVGQTYEDIQEHLQLPTLTDEWRALGTSSEALASAWTQVRGLTQGEGYAEAVEELTSAAREHGQKLPRRLLDLDAETLRAQGVDDEAQRTIRETVTAFMPALARETLHTSLWLSRLSSPDEAKLSGVALLRGWTVPHGYRTDTVIA